MKIEGQTFWLSISIREYIELKVTCRKFRVPNTPEIQLSAVFLTENIHKKWIKRLYDIKLHEWKIKHGHIMYSPIWGSSFLWYLRTIRLILAMAHLCRTDFFISGTLIVGIFKSILKFFFWSLCSNRYSSKSSFKFIVVIFRNEQIWWRALFE